MAISVSETKEKALFIWLASVAVTVILMVVLGGVTRLTHSGLSMVTWEPLTGWLPPLNNAEWNQLFLLYQQYPEFKQINFGMSLEEFKQIFWLEYLHRVWGRIIGLVFIIPFFAFKMLGWINAKLQIHLLILLALGVCQGFLGWFMVKSGLVDRPDVSQYRLACHLCLAFIIFGYLLFLCLSLQGWEINSVPAKVSVASKSITVLIFVTVFSGALVAGLNGGLVYNTFPLMDGDLLPNDLFPLTPMYLNFFENILTVQFDHRLLALACFISIMAFWIAIRRTSLSKYQRVSINALAIVCIIQVCLGVLTLIYRVPLVAATLHQAGGLLLFGASVWVSTLLHYNKQNVSLSTRRKKMVV